MPVPIDAQPLRVARCIGSTRDFPIDSDSLCLWGCVGVENNSVPVWLSADLSPIYIRNPLAARGPPCRSLPIASQLELPTHSLPWIPS